MAEARKLRFDQIFRCTPKHDDERNVVGKARWKERYAKNVASTISHAKQLKNFFHSRVISQREAASKETKPPCSIQESNSQSKRSKPSFKKPPFIVPGRIIYNDLHLLQSIPQVKNPSAAKKTVTRTGFVKVASSHYGTSRQTVGKSRLTTNTAKSSESIKDACPQCKGFIPPKVVLIPGQSIPSYEVDHLQASSAMTPSHVSTANPWVTVDRRTSAQKPFNLLDSQESSTPQVPHFPENEQDLDSLEDLDGESKPSDNEHRNTQDLMGKLAEYNFKSCNPATQEERRDIVAIAEVHQNKSDVEFRESVALKTEFAIKTEVKEDSIQQSIDAENSVEVVQQLREQVVLRNNDITKSESGFRESVIQTSPSMNKLEENALVLQQYLHAVNMEVAQQLRAKIDEKKTQLDELCRLWENRLEGGNGIPNDEIGTVLTVIGQTKQLQRERFHQYAGLIFKFENNSDEKKITKTDLEGFWEMILLQVTDVENKFNELDFLHNDGWTRQDKVECKLKKTRKLKKNEKKKNVGEFDVKPSGIRSHIASLRNKQTESNSLIAGFCVSIADHPSLVNPREEAFPIPLNDKTSQIIQPAIELTSNEKFSIPSKIPETPEYITVLRGKRRKHNSASNIMFFSSPHQTDTPRQRSHSTNFMLDQPPLVSRFSTEKGRMPSSQLLEIPKIFSPTVEQLITRTGRISRSPDRFGKTEEQKIALYTEMSKGLSPTLKQFVTRTGRISRSPDRFGQTEECKVCPYPPQSRLSQYTKPQQQNLGSSVNYSEHVEAIATNTEENNNDLRESFPATLPNFPRKN